MPASGGETEYVSTRLAWERLDARRSSGSSIHSRGMTTRIRAGDRGRFVASDKHAALPPQCWRMVWKKSAKAATSLYVASHAYAIEGMDEPRRES